MAAPMRVGAAAAAPTAPRPAAARMSAEEQQRAALEAYFANPNSPPLIGPEAIQGAASQAQLAQYFANPNSPPLINPAAIQATAQAARTAQAPMVAEQQRRDELSALDQRMFSDLGFLDPAYQQQMTAIGPSAQAGAMADPNAIAGQQAAYQGLMNSANAPMNWRSSAEQEALSGQWGQVRSGQGAPAFQGSGAQQALSNQWAGIQAGQGAPSFLGDAQQQQLMQQLLGVKAPEFAGAGTQQKVLDQILGQTTGPNAGLTFDTSGRQAEQYGNLNDIVKGGGADAIEMARRQAQRADQESWLRGQREADLQDYAERGLTGSGQELLALSSDRQAAAGRNSLADLETAAALEERRLGAINSAAGLATNMRGQTIDEQGLIANKSLAGLGAAASLANSMRGADFNEQSFLNESARQQAVQAAGIAESMRNQGFNEKTYLDERALKALEQQTGLQTDMRNQTFNEASYLDKRALEALQAQTDIADKLRQQQYQEQSFERGNQTSAYGQAGQLADSARSQSFNEASTRGAAADKNALYNNELINKSAASNVDYLRDQRDLQRQQEYDEYMKKLSLGLDTAGSLYNAETRENAAGYNSGAMLGSQNAAAYADAQARYNASLLGQQNIASQQNLAAQQAQNAQLAQMGKMAGGWVDTVITGASNMGGGMAGAAAGGGTASAPSTNLTAPSNLTYKPTGSTYSGLTKADDDDEDK